MKNFYFAMLEIETVGHSDEQYQRIADAMTELKTAAEPIGMCAFYQVKYEHQYRKAEREIKDQIK
jgi:hypothetical protein